MRWILPAVVAVLAIAAVGAALVVDRDDASSASSEPPPHVVTPVFSVRRDPEWLQRPGGRDRLELALQPFFDEAPPDRCVVVTDGGNPLVDENPDLPVVPGSNQKLLVATATLDQLGADATFSTTASSVSPVQDGTINGDLYVVGGGDPVLATGDFLAQFADDPVYTDYATLADEIAATGVTTITGNVVGDDGRYDPIRTVESWPDRELGRSAPGPLSALAVNRGFVSFPDSPDSKASPRAADDPPTQAASLLIDLLEERGVSVNGQATTGLEPKEANEIATVESPPARDIVRQMLTTSDNTIAEMLTKELGLRRLGQGTTDGGTQAIRDILAEDGLPLDGVEIHDGSGLHDDDRVTCTLLLALLGRAGDDSDLADALSVAGESGTLRGCFVDSPAEGKVRAKTGTLEESTALSGFMETLPGQELTFSYVLNDDHVDQAKCPDARDTFVEALLPFPEGPATDELAPLPVLPGS
jgi:serine-type D-Ala-D-Ala carboxypeptidase/endopeptidase (penicillin-binding protein 4)